MKSRIKWFITGFLIAVLLINVISADTMTKTIEVLFNNAKVLVNGKNIEIIDSAGIPVSPLIYNGSTYLPIKTLVDAFDKNITYDKATNSYIITDKVIPSPTPAIIEKKENSRSNPNNIGVAINMTTTTYDNIRFETQISLKEIIRGTEAYKLIKAANQFNREPEVGYEYILAKFYLKFIDGSDIERQFQMNDLDFTLISSDGFDYKRVSIVEPPPQFEAKLYKGASTEGWVAFAVKTTDLKPLIVTGRDYNGKGGVWFKGYSENQGSNSVSTNILSPLIQPTPSPTTVIQPTVSMTNPTNAKELKQYLEENYSTLDTCIGTTNFKFNIYENDRSYEPYDYWIQVGYEYEYFGGAMTSNKYASSEKAKLKRELREHMEKLGRDIVAKMPDKKFYCNYYDSWYKYPNLRVDLQTRMYFTWKNYSEPNDTSLKNTYEKTKPSSFRWDSFIDDEL